MNGPDSPYKGLDPFDDSELDALLFFGRERERDVVIANLMAARLTLFYGPSGVGKSSLLNAGVCRRLRDEPEGHQLLVIGSWVEDRAEELGLKPRGRIVASFVAAIRPEIMGLGPIPAIRSLLKQTGMAIGDVDIVEINEAFAAQIVPCKDELGIPEGKLNPFGGAIALGHPFGMTGARIMTTLLNGLRALDGTYGIESMCVAGGMGQAMLVERLA